MRNKKGEMQEGVEEWMELHMYQRLLTNDRASGDQRETERERAGGQGGGLCSVTSWMRRFHK